MKKSLILTFVFAVISFAGAFAQNTLRSPQAEKAKQEQKTDKATPSDARPSGQTKVEKVQNIKKGNKGKHKGHHKPHKGQGKAKGHSKSHHDKEAHEGHEGHNHETGGEGHGRRAEDKKRVEKNRKAPVEAPSNNKTQKQGGQN